MSSNHNREVYLDNNATTEPLTEVHSAMLEVLGPGFGNPSSDHSTGDRARNRMFHARESIARLIGADASDIIFTSGGTEANNLVLGSALRSGPTRARVVTTTVEHSSVLRMCEHLEESGVDVVYLPVNRGGLVSMRDVAAAITSDTALVTVQWINNETGVIQPVEQIGALCRERSVPFHTDAAQAVGKIEMNVSELPIDLLTLTAHKFHGPQGTGALYAACRSWLAPMLFGGSQERGLRPGTENVPGIVGMGRAAEVRLGRLATTIEALRKLRDRFEQRALDLVPDVDVNGDREHRVCNTTNLLFGDVDGQALVAQLDQRGIRCSQSSACTSRRPEPSYVLRAMGLSADGAFSSVRFSVSEMNTEEELDWAVEQIADVCEHLRRFNGRLTGSVGAMSRAT